MKKSLVVLSLTLVAMLVLSCIPVTAGFNGSGNVQGLYLDFETDAEKSMANGGATGTNPYYAWVSGEGVGYGSSNGCLKVCPAAVNNEAVYASGFQTNSGLKTGDITYTLSFKYMVKTDGRAVQMYPLVRAVNSSGIVTKVGSLATEKYDAETMAYTRQTSNASGTAVTTAADGKWHEYNWQFKLDGTSGFGIGSGSQTTINSMDAFSVCIRFADDGQTGTSSASSEVYIDDIVVAPVTKSYPEVYTTPYEGSEIFAKGNINGKYESSPNGGYSANSPVPVVIEGTGAEMDATGRGIANTAGRDGDKVYIFGGNGGTDDNVLFQGHGNQYNIKGLLEDYTLYKVTLRMKAPEFVLDETITDGNWHVSSDGTVKAKSAANGKIGGSISAYILRDTDEGEQPVFFTDIAAGTKPVLTTDWVEYVGYIYFDPTAAQDWDKGTPGLMVYVSGDEGLVYFDNLSIKPIIEENLIMNGDFAINVPSIYSSTTGHVAPLGIVPNIENNTSALMEYNSTGLYVYNSNSTQPGGYRALEGRAALTAGKTYKLEVNMRMAISNVTGNLAINITKGGNTQVITADTAVNSTYTTYTYVFKASEDIAAANELDVSKISFVASRDASATNGKSCFYKYVRLTQLPDNYVENIAVTGSMRELGTITANWTKQPADSTATHLVKFSLGDDANGYHLLCSSTTTGTTETIILPAGTAGKKVKVEVVTYVDGDAINTTSYVTTDAIAEVMDGITITDATKGASEFSAKVSYVGTENAFIIVATYDSVGRMVNVLTFDLAKDGTEVPVSITSAGSTSAKIMVFDGTNLSDTTLRPMCDCVEIQ